MAKSSTSPLGPSSYVRQTLPQLDRHVWAGVWAGFEERDMAKVSQRLSALNVKRLSEPGYHADGAGLYLRIIPVDERDEGEVKRPTPKGWIFRFRHGGRTRDMGLGAYPD